MKPFRAALLSVGVVLAVGILSVLFAMGLSEWLLN